MFDLLDLPHRETLDSEYLAQAENIRQRYEALSETEKNKRARDIAALLGVSEAQVGGRECRAADQRQAQYRVSRVDQGKSVRLARSWR